MIDRLLIQEWLSEYLDNLKSSYIFKYSEIKIREGKNLFLFIEDLLIPTIMENGKLMNKTYTIFIEDINVFYKHEDKISFISYLENLLKNSSEYTQFLNRLNHEFISTN